MAKLTKAQTKAHNEAVKLLEKDKLTEDDKEFVFRNWNEGAAHMNGAHGAFFTPFDMAFDFSYDVGGGRVIDLCAGIGMLSYAVMSLRNMRDDNYTPEITCVERNPDYVEVGKKLLPEADWICADVFDVIGMGLHDPNLFDYAISNPPFGNIKRQASAPRYQGSDFEFHVIDIAAHIARHGTFIVPQNSAGFKYSGRNSYQRDDGGKAFKFQEMAGVYFAAGCGVDTAYYRDDWKGVSPLCEIVCVDFDPDDNEWPVVGDASKQVPLEQGHNDNEKPTATDLFGFAS